MPKLNAIQIPAAVVADLFTASGLSVRPAMGAIEVQSDKHAITYFSDAQMLTVNSTRFHGITPAKALDLIEALEADND